MRSTIRRVVAAMIAATLTLGVGIAAAVSSGHADARASSTHVVKTLGGEVFKPNVSATMTLRFAPGNITVHTGDTVVFQHADQTHDPHSVSIVAASQLPHSADDCPVCQKFEKAHFPHGQNGPPLPVVDVGKPGFDQPGDSIVWMSGRASVKVTAAAGTVLHYFCAVHPWMQGTIRVVK
jgi:plastocyanin